MMNNLKKKIKEKKNIINKSNKNYRRIIVGILLIALGFILPQFVGNIAILGTLFDSIDNLWNLISSSNTVITPLIYFGIIGFGLIKIAFNIIKLQINKIKLKQLDTEEEEMIDEINKKIDEIVKESNLTKEEISDVKDETKEILVELKKDVLNITSNSKNEDELLEDNNKIKRNKSSQIKVKKIK